MKKPLRITQEIANAKISVPLHKDANTSKKISEEVSERIREIEDETGRIDTQAYALRAAFEFAAKAHAQQEGHEKDIAEFIKALDAIQSRLREIGEAFKTD